MRNASSVLRSPESVYVIIDTDRVGVSESVVWGFSFEQPTNNYSIFHLSCVRSLVLFFQKKIILYPTAYFKCQLDGVC